MAMVQEHSILVRPHNLLSITRPVGLQIGPRSMSSFNT